MDAAALIADYGLIALPVLLVLAGLLLVNQDLVLLLAGWGSAHAGLELPSVLVVAYPSLLLCDQILYTVCRAGGRFAASRNGWFARVTAPLVARGMLAVFVARFMAGTRGFVYALIGVNGLSRPRFLIADALAALISVPLWIWLGRTYGPALWEAVRPYALVLLAALVAGGVAMYVLRPKTTG